MPTRSDLWDDSALINAFDQAMSKYKRLHVQGYKGDSAAVEHVQSTANKDSSTVNAFSVDKESDLESGYEHKHALGLVVGMRQEDYSGGYLGTDNMVSGAPDDFTGGSNGNTMPEIPQCDPYSHNTEDYHELCRQYNELEVQKQNILGKIQQFSNWNYSCPIEGSYVVQRDSVSSPPVHQSSPSQAYSAYYPNVLAPSCPLVCQSPCFSIPCSFSVPCTCTPYVSPATAVGVARQSVVADAGIMKTAMGAIQRAMSTVRDQASGNQAETEDSCAIKPDTSCEMDLTVVLNAWFSAGFHTAKYLANQSACKEAASISQPSKLL